MNCAWCVYAEHPDGGRLQHAMVTATAAMQHLRHDTARGMLCAAASTLHDALAVVIAGAVS
jgi:hypothetical protein